MRLSKAWSSHLTTGLTLGFTVLFSFSIMHAQGMSSRSPSGARYGNSLPSLDALATIQADADAPPIRPQAETISVHELLLPAGAVKEFQRSEKAVRSGDFRSAAEHLRNAIQIAPSFAQAHNNLGATYIQLNEYESGVAEFRAAMARPKNRRIAPKFGTRVVPSSTLS